MDEKKGKMGESKGMSPILATAPSERVTRCNIPPTAHNAPDGMIFHFLNRGNALDPIFEKPEDYAAFENVLSEAQEQVLVRVLSGCLRPNYWHPV